MTKPLYKVLLDGKSCHGGDFKWSLPQGSEPGSWHSHTGQLVMCQSGFHVTDDPAVWWNPGCSVYAVEVDELQEARQGDKAVCGKIRLLRLATEAELLACRIYTTGHHSVSEGNVRAYGSASVRAYDSASVRAYGSASVEASGSASVEASGSASVEAYGSASVRASNCVTVVTWRKSCAIKLLTDEAVWIDRSGEHAVVQVASQKEIK